MVTRNGLLLSFVCACGGSSHATSSSAATSSLEMKEPLAIARLVEMGGFLRKQDLFTVTGTTQTDEVLLSGQKVTLTSRVELDVHRPDRLHAIVDNERKKREFFYDGSRFTMYAPVMGYYATTSAPPTIRELITVLEQRFGIDMPFVDLFYWGTAEQRLDVLTSAIAIGPATVDGVPCDQFAFRQNGLDWQIWIEQGDRPLPHLLVLTTTDDPAQPQHTVTMRWNLSPKLTEDRFVFTPPRNGHQIAFNSLSSAEVTARR